MGENTQPLERIARFLEQAEDLRKRTLVQRGGLKPFTFSWHANSEAGPADTENEGVTPPTRPGTLSVEGHAPETPLELDLWRSFLVTYRLFTMDKEVVFLAKVLRDAANHVHDEELRESIQYLRQRWRAGRGSRPVKIEVNHQEMTGRRLSDLWINGHYFHTTNPDLAAELRALPVYVRDILHGFFQSYTIEVTNIVLALAKIIWEAEKRGALRPEPVVASKLASAGKKEHPGEGA